jgi:hypothetical protein
MLSNSLYIPQYLLRPYKPRILVHGQTSSPDYARSPTVVPQYGNHINCSHIGIDRTDFTIQMQVYNKIGIDMWPLHSGGASCDKNNSLDVRRAITLFIRHWKVLLWRILCLWRRTNNYPRHNLPYSMLYHLYSSKMITL